MTKKITIATWNVNSVRTRLPNLIDWLGREKPDYVCLQELKCQEDQFPFDALKDAGYAASVVGQKAYNGVAILSKKPVKTLETSIGDEQARYIEAEIEGGIRLIGIYAPNGNPVDSEKFPYKLDWLKRLKAKMQSLLDDEIPFVVTGDYNIIPEAIDARNPDAWVGDALFQPESRAMYRAMLNMGLTDALRVFHAGADGLYTFWDYQAGAWPRDHGIRIDHFLLSPKMADSLRDCVIHRDERAKDKASDHVPVLMTISNPS